MVSVAASSIRRGPNRSTMIPVGTCIAAYRPNWSITKEASCAEVRPSRSAAIGPATPSEVRWKTASR